LRDTRLPPGRWRSLTLDEVRELSGSVSASEDDFDTEDEGDEF
jgi:hypothetical protein